MASDVTSDSAPWLPFVDGGARMAEEPPADLADALIDALVTRGDATTLDRLASGTRPRLAKAARKGLHRLRSRGAKIATTARSAGPAVMPLGEVAEVRISSPDGAGERLIAFVVPSPGGGGSDHAHFRISDELGVMEAFAAQGPRRIFKDVIRRFSAGGVAFGQIAPARGVAIIAGAFALTTSLGRATPPNYPAAWGLLRPLGPPVGGAVLPAADKVVDAKALLALPDLQTWAPPTVTLRALEARMIALDESTLVLDEAQKAEARSVALEQAVSAMVEPEIRTRLAGRLRDAAEACAADGRAGDAAKLLGQAVRLEGGGVDASEPFLRGLLRKVLPTELADEGRL